MSRNGSRKSSRPIAGFTLVELLVVIGIIALLISILMPALQKARYQAQLTVCLARLQQLATSANIYANEYKGKLPEWDLPIGGPPNLWDVSTDHYDYFRTRLGLAHEMFFCPLAQPELPEYFYAEPGPSGFYRFGYSLWVPRKSSTAYYIPPGPVDGSGMTIIGNDPVAGPRRLGDPLANKNPIWSDVVLSNGTTPTFASDISRDKTLGIYPYSQHLRLGLIDSSHSAYADGHVERVSGDAIKPRFLSWNGYWNWR